MQLLKRYYPIVLLSIPLFFIGYFTNRANFPQLITLVAIAGLAYFLLLKFTRYTKKEIIVVGICLRVLLLFFTPNLSDDYYRFIWDGQVTVDGHNPYLVLPSEFIAKEDVKHSKHYQQLYEKLNSPDYYTVYPPFNQFLFMTASAIGGQNMWLCSLVLKLFILLFEIAIFYILFLILKQLKLPEYLASIYVFNPLVIIELVGNIHFEGVMLCFLLLSIYLILTNKLLLAGIVMAFAINTKLIPLMFLPLFIGYLGWQKSIWFYVVVGVSVLLMFLPYYNGQIIENFSSSIDLYFQKFEFNASVYYLVRWIGFEITGYNIIASVGYVLPLIVIAIIAWKSVTMKRVNTSQLLQNMLLFLMVYYAVATIVHPWYVINLVVLAVFVKSRAVLVWSVVVYLSYFAYSNYVDVNFDGDKHQSSIYFGLVGLEYLIVFTVWFFSLKSKRVLSQ